MLKKAYQRLSDPVFYRRRWALLRNRFHSPDERELDLGDYPQDRALVVIAHPDDEVFCSGLICNLAESGSEVSVFCLTRGEGGPLPGGTERHQLGKLREREMIESCKRLGVSHLEFLDHVDPVGQTYRTFPPAVRRSRLVAQLDFHIKRLAPDLIITHGSWGEYWHPAHLLLHEAVIDAARNRHVLTFQAHWSGSTIPEITNRADPAHFRFDFSRHHDQRLAALEAHQSQVDLFGKFAGGSHADFIRLSGKEGYSLAG